MELPINDEEFEYLVTQLWKCRGSEPKCKDLYEKMKLVKEVRDENPDGPYLKILREKYNMVA